MRHIFKNGDGWNRGDSGDRILCKLELLSNGSVSGKDVTRKREWFRFMERSLNCGGSGDGRKGGLVGVQTLLQP